MKDRMNGMGRKKNKRKWEEAQPRKVSVYCKKNMEGQAVQIARYVFKEADCKGRQGHR